MGDNSSYLQFFNLFFEVCLVFFLLVSIGCIVKLWQLKITLAQVCKIKYTIMETKIMHALLIPHLLPNILELLYTFCYFFQTSIDFTCRDQRDDPE